MPTANRVLLCCLLSLGLSACTVHRAPSPGGEPPPPPVPSQPAPGTPSGTPSGPVTDTPPPAPTRMKTHSRYAPPPSGSSYWDNALGVYVLENTPGLYYRERVYYRWQEGWSYSESPNGPWHPTDVSGVPAGLGSHYGK